MHRDMLPGVPLLELRERACPVDVGIGDDQVLEMRAVGPDLVHQRQERRLGDEHARCGVVQDVLRLPRLEHHVHRRSGRPKPDCGPARDQELG